MSVRSLENKTILITRAHQLAAPLAAMIRQAGGEALVFPTIEIRDPVNIRELDERITHLDDYDWAIFISPTAVSRGMEQISGRRDLPAGLRIAAVGEGSARELRKKGLVDVLAPQERYDSEALLSLPEMQQVAGKRMVIFRGEGGRELLANELRRRGARVDYAECYQRAKPDVPIEGLNEEGSQGKIQGIVAASSEGLKNLLAMLGEKGLSWLMAVPVFVHHPAIAKAAGELGFSRVIIAEGGDLALLQGMIEHLARQP